MAEGWFGVPRPAASSNIEITISFLPGEFKGVKGEQLSRGEGMVVIETLDAMEEIGIEVDSFDMTDIAEFIIDTNEESITLEEQLEVQEWMEENIGRVNQLTVRGA